MASSKREKELARQRAERQAARRAAAAAKRRQRAVLTAVVATVAVVLVALVGAGFLLRDRGTSSVSAAATSPAPSSAPSSAAATGAKAAPSSAASPAAGGKKTCTFTASTSPAARQVALPPPTGIETRQPFVVTMATNRGTVVFQTDTAGAPCTVQSLRSLAHFRYFDKTPCHRLTTQSISVLQCGDPSGTGNGGPGYTFADENLSGATYPRGTVAMANAGPGTNGSQFFLVYKDSQLPANYTPFARITQGLDVLERVAAAGSDDSNGAGDGKPKLAVQITTLRVTPKAS